MSVYFCESVPRRPGRLAGGRAAERQLSSWPMFIDLWWGAHVGSLVVVVLLAALERGEVHCCLVAMASTDAPASSKHCWGEEVTDWAVAVSFLLSLPL